VRVFVNILNTIGIAFYMISILFAFATVIFVFINPGLISTYAIAALGLSVVAKECVGFT